MPQRTPVLVATKVLHKLVLRSGSAGTLRSGCGSSPCMQMTCSVYLLSGLSGHPAHREDGRFFSPMFTLAIYHTKE